MKNRSASTEQGWHAPRPTATLVVCLSVSMLALSLCSTALAQSIITFDAPGSGSTAPGQGTGALSINPTGTIAGYTRDDNWVRHAFLRHTDGSFTIFDAPGAGTCPPDCSGDAGFGPGTRAFSINPAGTITGFYSDNSSFVHAYVRAADGTVTTFSAPDAGTGPYPQGTFPQAMVSINPAGVITGWYVDSSYVFHGFVRGVEGTITEFDPAGSTFTQPIAINPAGTITGSYADAMGAFHAFVRAPNGAITSFDVPGAVGGTFPSEILPDGATEGNWVDAASVNHGFVGLPGAITTFDIAGAGTDAGQGTLAGANNTSGTITGFYVDTNNASHAFVRAKQGGILTFDAPGAGTGAFQGTVPFGITPSGAITGFYIDASNVRHGFLRTP